MFSFSVLTETRFRSSHSHSKITVYIHSLAPELCSSPALCHNIVRGAFDHLDVGQIITLVHCIDAVMLITPDEQEVARTLDALGRHMYSRGRQNPERFRSLAHR